MSPSKTDWLIVENDIGSCYHACIYIYIYICIKHYHKVILYLFSFHTNMKSLHCVYSGNRFADQYTLDLEGFVSLYFTINPIDD